MGYPCRLNCMKECDGCGRCEPEEEYILYCDKCRREIENLEEYCQLGDHAYCQECIDASWRQWYCTPEGLPARIRKLRLRHNMTQPQFAEKIGVSESLVSAWERGERPVKERYLYEIQNRMGDEP